MMMLTHDYAGVCLYHEVHLMARMNCCHLDASDGFAKCQTWLSAKYDANLMILPRISDA
jgi:hypothetical protein